MSCEIIWYSPHRGEGVGTGTIRILRSYGKPVPEGFVAMELGRSLVDMEPYFSELEKIGRVERENGYIWIKPFDFSKSINPASA